MSKTIQIKYKWNKKNVEKLFDSSYAYIFNNSAQRYIGWFFLALSQFSIVAALKKDSFALLLFSTIVLFYWYYLRKVLAKKRAIKSFESSEFKDKTISITIDESGFKLNDERENNWSWDEIESVVSLVDDVLLYKTPHAHYIPASGFNSLEDKNSFKMMAKERGILK